MEVVAMALRDRLRRRARLEAKDAKKDLKNAPESVARTATRGATAARRTLARAGEKAVEQAREADLGDAGVEPTDDRAERAADRAAEKAMAGPVLDATLDPLTSPEETERVASGAPGQGAGGLASVDQLVMGIGEGLDGGSPGSNPRGSGPRVDDLVTGNMGGESADADDGDDPLHFDTSVLFGGED